MAASKSQLLSLQTAAQPPSPDIQATSVTPESTLPQSDPMVTSQELSVAQMMMTLARASNKNAVVNNGGNSTQDANSQLNPPDRIAK